MSNKKEILLPQICDWQFENDLMRVYHDTEWGVPLYDDRKLFEFLVLDSFQAGLSWSIVLKKRDSLRRAFDSFDISLVAAYNDEKLEQLCANPEIIRNRAKIGAAVHNARIVLQLQEEYGSFSRYLWNFVGGKTIANAWKSMQEIPAVTPESHEMSRDMKARGFIFVGATICYAFMQSVGMVNDHLVGCFRHEALQRIGKSVS